MVLDRKLYKWFYDNFQSKYYNLITRWCFFPFGGEEKVRKTMLGEVDLKASDKILDMCCGPGNNTFVVAKMLGNQSNIRGIDLSQGQIEMAKKRNQFPNIEFMVMDASNTSFAEGEFDKVIIPHALHEMSRVDRLAVLREARRILKDNGTLVVLEMDNPSSFFLRLFIGFWWFYWLPFNFETPTRRDMLKCGLLNEVKETGFKQCLKSSLYNGVLQVVQGKY
jgi:demethylmenaquinone methyltransferase/2-methoxy-6-polyprenyl-1,4-benzoquinol methylase